MKKINCLTPWKQVNIHGQKADLVGSLLTLDEEANINYRHGISKINNPYCGPRINITWRVLSKEK
jgi:hypothetical protein